jgi:hypothetical protein
VAIEAQTLPQSKQRPGPPAWATPQTAQQEIDPQWGQRSGMELGVPLTTVVDDDREGASDESRQERRSF